MREETMTMKTLLRLAFEHQEVLSGVLMTPLLEAAAGVPLQVSILCQRLHRLEVAMPELVLDQGEPVLERRVLLRARGSRLGYLYSESLMVPDALPLSVSIRLLQREELLETIMQECRLPIFREVIAHGRARLGEIAEKTVTDHLETSPETDVFYRTSLLYITQRPHCATMRITEMMPVAYVVESPDGSALDPQQLRTEPLL